MRCGGCQAIFDWLVKGVCWMDEQTWQEEQARVDSVMATIRRRMAEMEPQMNDLHDQVQDLRQNFWDEVTVDTSSPEDFEETFYSINQQTTILAERERGQQVFERSWKSLQRLLVSPYFGRVDFQEDGQKWTESIYIGVSSLLDDDELTFLIYDWRTPIASLYYDHVPGSADFEAPIGKITGEMIGKRQYQIRDGHLEAMFDASITIGDALLQAALSKGSDTQMRSIVATIQREQNAIIRDTKSRTLIVQGSAGSGKTSAAMQRIAYLLFKYRETLRADQIVLFSPNPLFTSYVSTVLPELGEENMQQSTFQEYLALELSPLFHRVEDAMDQIELELSSSKTADERARCEGMAFKASGAFHTLLQQYVRDLEQQGMLFQAITFHDREVIAAKAMQEEYDKLPATMRVMHRVHHLQKWLFDQMKLLELEMFEEDWVDEAIQYLDREAYADVFSTLHKEREVFDIHEQFAKGQERLHKKRRADEADFDFGHQEEQLLRQKVVRRAMKAVWEQINTFAFIDLHGLYAQVFSFYDEASLPTKLTDWPFSMESMARQTKANFEAGVLTYEDATPFLFLKEEVLGIQTDTQIQYVLIDEAQDYSGFQFAYLKKRFPRARFTLLGDFRQAIFAETTPFEHMDTLLGEGGVFEQATILRLLRSYRQTYELVEFTKSLVQDGEEIIPFSRHGQKPLLFLCHEEASKEQRIGEDIERLFVDGCESVAVMTKTAKESERIAAILQRLGRSDAKVVTKETTELPSGLVLVPVYLAKGIEFDAVILWDASSTTFSDEKDRKLLYTACTRAMHHLILYACDAFSPWIRHVNPQTYDRVG